MSSQERKISPETIEAAKKRAEELSRRDPEFAKGAEDMKKLGRAAGTPAARIMLGHLIAAGGAPATVKAALRKRVAKIELINLTGCLTIDFFNPATHAKETLYPVLDECPAGHDFDAELARVKAFIAAEKWPMFLHHLSVLVALGRGVYHAVLEENKELVSEIMSHLTDAQKEEFAHGMLVDTKDTTLYVLKDWPQRVGIFIKNGALCSV